MMEFIEVRRHRTELRVQFKKWSARIWIQDAGGARERRQIALAISRMISEVHGQFRPDSWIYHPDGYWANQVRDQERDIPLGRAPRIDTDEGRMGFEIRIKRLKAGWSQRELARRAGIDYSNLSLIERGRVRMRESTFIRIHDAFRTAENAVHGNDDEARLSGQAQQIPERRKDEGKA